MKTGKWCGEGCKKLPDMKDRARTGKATRHEINGPKALAEAGHWLERHRGPRINVTVRNTLAAIRSKILNACPLTSLRSV